MRRLTLAGVLAGLVLGGLPAASAWADPGVAVSDVRTAGSQLTFTVSARNLPAGTVLDGRNLAVDVDGTPLPVTVLPAPSASPSAAPDGSVVLVMDTSGSMAGARLAGAKAAAASYADALPARIRLGLVAVSDKPTSVLAPTPDRAAFHAALAGLQAGGATALYDGIGQAVAMLAGARPGQRQIVVLTDGADTASSATAAQEAGAVGGAKARLDVIGYGPDANTAALHDLATRSGGRVVAAADAPALQGAFARISTGPPPPVTASVQVRVPNWLAGTGATLNVTLTAGTSRLRAAGTPVTFPAGPGPAAASVPRSARWPLDLALLATLAAALLGGAGVVYLVVGRSSVRVRLRQLEGFGRAPAAAAGDGAFAGSALRAAVSGAESVIARRGNLERIEAELDRAGMNLRAPEWIILRFGVSLLSALLLAVLLPWLAGLVLGGVLGWAGTGGYRRLRTARRARQFGDQLPEALQLVVSALRSGFSFPQSIGALAEEGEATVAGEFGRALAETRVGGDLEEALLRVADRNASEDLSWLVMAIRVQREVGGTLSEVLETAVGTMRERGRLRRHVRALSAEGRLSAWVLAGMPIVLAAFMFTFRREYLRPLYTTPLGLMMLACSVVMMGFGIFWMTRVIRVEV